MADDPTAATPQSPEVEPPAVREELHQAGVTHEGTRQAPVADDATGRHLGATDDEVTPIRAPMRGPANLVGQAAPGADDDEDLIDPADEITPG